MKSLRSNPVAAALVVGFTGVILLCLVLTVVKAARSGTAVPAPPAVEETEDCDDEDRTKGQWWECGPGVVKPKVSAKPAVKASPSPKKRS